MHRSPAGKRRQEISEDRRKHFPTSLRHSSNYTSKIVDANYWSVW